MHNGETIDMFRLVLASFLTLGVLFGMLFAILTVAMLTQGLSVWFAVAIVIVIAGVQYLISPFIIQWVHKIEWVSVDSLDPDVAAMVRGICVANRLREPRFGLIRDGNPNAFTFGHYPGNARVIVTSGLLEVCDTEQRKAVVAHEMGHVIHWDSVVMTVAATVPLILYYIFRFGMRTGRGRNGAAALVVGLTAFVFYIISQYVVLLLSRVREYYADAYSAQATGNPNALATGLVKIAYGLARAKPADADDEKKREPSAAAVGMKAFGIFDPTFGKSMAVAGAGMFGLTDQAQSGAAATEAMKWDLWNPWAFFMELRSTHPLPAKRIRELGKLAEQNGQVPELVIPANPPESYWDEFGVDLFMSKLPLLGLIVGLAVGAVFLMQEMFVTGGGIALLGIGVGMLLRMTFTYPRGRFGEGHVRNLVGEVKVSGVRPIPVTLTGTVIGRGIPGLYWGDDLVVQDDTGFMLMQYRQPIGVLEMLFGLFRAESFIGQRVVAEGWYRRAPIPYLELWKVRLPNGEVHTCHNWGFAIVGALLVTGLGLAGGLLGLIGGI
jgi:Zn-dependent protease with chaperone function